MQLRGKRAVVTGASRGIGAAIARALSGEGAELLIAARSGGAVEALARELTGAGRRTLASICDVTDEASVRALAETADRELGGADILVNNAGIASSAPIKSTTLEDWNRIFAVNATGTFLCTKAFVGQMANRGWGRVINVASITAKVGAPYIAAYTASKHAVLGLTRVAAAEYGEKGVTVNAVCPGYVDTDMTEESVTRVMKKSGLDHATALAAILKTANQKRLVTPDEVAFIVVTLASEAAGGVNGQAIVVDGGGLLA
jgi:NAD(P)-dependent dehydrogenase (short-subunit alcohol dehydrogenase family)